MRKTSPSECLSGAAIICHSVESIGNVRQGRDVTMRVLSLASRLRKRTLAYTIGSAELQILVLILCAMQHREHFLHF